MWHIVPRLYLGDQKDARDLLLLRGHGVTHVINCAAELPCWYATEFRYLRLGLRDPDPDFRDHIPRACKFIRRGRRAGSVLVHCRAGLSRSPSVVLAYLCSRGKTLDEALEILRRAVGERDGFIEPDASFLEQIESHFDDLES